MLSAMKSSLISRTVCMVVLAGAPALHAKDVDGLSAENLTAEQLFRDLEGELAY